MPDITYRPQPGDPVEVQWGGRTFRADKPESFDGRKTDHKAIIESARGNPYFEVDGESSPQKKNDKFTTTEEYRAYATDWINKAKTVREMEGRWRDEEKLRDEVGWGSDDQALIAPIYEPKLENLKRAEA